MVHTSRPSLRHAFDIRGKCARLRAVVVVRRLRAILPLAQVAFDTHDGNRRSACHKETPRSRASARAGDERAALQARRLAYAVFANRTPDVRAKQGGQMTMLQPGLWPNAYPVPGAGVFQPQPYGPALSQTLQTLQFLPQQLQQMQQLHLLQHQQVQQLLQIVPAQLQQLQQTIQAIAQQIPAIAQQTPQGFGQSPWSSFQGGGGFGPFAQAFTAPFGQPGQVM
jgi:hypothetical protein